VNRRSRISWTNCCLFYCVIGVSWFAVQQAAPGQSGTSSDAPVVVQSDSGTYGGAVSLEALPNRSTTNSLRKTFTIKSLEGVKSAQLLLYAALRDPTDRPNFSFAEWEWIFFELNGYRWVRRVEDLPMHRRSLFGVDWDDVTWAAVRIPEISYLQQGVNELIIWNNNPPDKPKDKYLVVAYDDSGQSADSFSWAGDEWVNDDLNGERDGSPVGEWMIRLKLNQYALAQQEQRDAVGASRFQEAQEANKAFVWGFTDALHKVFPNRPYGGAIGNDWEIQAARNEYESCQLVVIPVATDLEMVDVSVGDFVSEDGAKISAEAATVRLVKTATVNNRQWPDPLPPTSPVDIARGRVQSFWITVHVPEECPAGRYEATVDIATASGPDENAAAAEAKLKLRVYDFSVPTLSRYQMVSAMPRPFGYSYHVVPCNYFQGWPSPRLYLDKQDNLRLDFTDFDRLVKEGRARGVTEFSVGRSFSGANQFTPECFDVWVDVEGMNQQRRIWLCPIEERGGENPMQARKWFEQYFTQLYEHLEAKGWTKYFYVYGADEPHGAEWTEPLTEYFALIHQLAPKLRIMITYGPTDRFGPNVDIACIMMNHLSADTIKEAQRYNQELWCYSCGDLNNPALTIPHPAITVRLWPWLQEKWGVGRVLLWHSMVDSSNYQHAGIDRRGDGQIFWHSTIGGQQVFYPSIRAEMLRDGTEDREYLYLLKQLVNQFEPRAQSDSEKKLLSEAQSLTEVPDEIVKTQFEMTRDVSLVMDRRAQIARTIERLSRCVE